MSTAPDRLTPRARAKRDQILTAARELFLERGFSGASTDAISSAAGVSKETLYRHFRNKEELLSDCLRGLISDLAMDDLLLAADGSRPVESQDEFRAALLRLAGGIVELLMQPAYLGLMRVVINENPRLPQLSGVFRSAVPENISRRVIDILESARESKVARVADTEAAGRMFVGPLLTYVVLDGLLAGEGPPQKPATDRIEAIVDLYVRAVTTA